MKLNIYIDTDNIYERDVIINLVNYLFSNKDNISQMKLDDGKDVKSRKYFCNNKSCGKEVAKDVVAFCLHKDNKDRFGGKVFCRECQEER